MIRLWITTHKDEKITRSLIVDTVDDLNIDSIYNTLSQHCHSLDIPTPMINNHMINCLKEFNSVTIRSGDFVESIDFDIMKLEIIPQA